jgi:TolB protein
MGGIVHPSRGASEQPRQGSGVGAAARYARSMPRAAVSLALALLACAHPPPPAAGARTRDLGLPEERHLRNVHQLTFGGENAEAYFSFDGRQLIFQSTRDGRECDQEYVMDAATGASPRLVSTGAGRVTCGYFFPAGDRILYSSTHATDRACPPRPDMSHGYAWALYGYQVYTARPDGSDVQALAPGPGYNAEATISKDGWIVFTSTRDGDLDLYKMRLDGSELTRLTSTPGYDGGAFFSADGTRIVYRASRPKDAVELAEYRALLAQGLVHPTQLEIWTMNADGSQQRQVTHLGAASFAPFFHPDGRRIIFASNVGDPKGRNFDLYLVNDDGTDLERITWNETFDGFPMFSPDGKKLVFASNRNGSRPGETNVFIADWVE